jgi:4,5-dihydroxyphthalate decarboxylase
LPHDVRLTLAINDSDQVRDVLSGAVPVSGVELTPLIFEPEEIFFRYSRYHEWELTELSMGKYATMRARGDDSAIAIPVFPSRSFRHSAIYIRPDGPVDDPAALAGGRIGVPEWSVTAVVYGRGILAHEFGVDLQAVHWVQGGTNDPGREEGLVIDPPPGFTITRGLRRRVRRPPAQAPSAAHAGEGADPGDP